MNWQKFINFKITIIKLLKSFNILNDNCLYYYDKDNNLIYNNKHCNDYLYIGNNYNQHKLFIRKYENKYLKLEHNFRQPINYKVIKKLIKYLTKNNKSKYYYTNINLEIIISYNFNNEYNGYYLIFNKSKFNENNLYKNFEIIFKNTTKYEDIKKEIKDNSLLTTNKLFKSDANKKPLNKSLTKNVNTRANRLLKSKTIVNCKSNDSNFGDSTNNVSDVQLKDSIVNEFFTCNNYINNTVNYLTIIPLIKNRFKAAINSIRDPIVHDYKLKIEEDTNTLKELKLKLNNKIEIAQITKKYNTNINIDDWNLNILELDKSQLYFVVYDIFKRNNFFEIFKIENNIFIDFMTKIEFYYSRNNNYFHNFYHGVAVFHSLYYLINTTCLNDLLDINTKFGMLIAALGHDLDHRGYNNNYEINSNSELSLIYHDKSPLEQHHCYILFKIITSDTSNIMKNIKISDFKELKIIIISSILGTDMQMHFNMLKEFKTKVLNNSILNNLEENLQDISDFLVHTADLNGSAKDIELSLKWSKLVNKEFSKQYQDEINLGLEGTPYFYDLENPNVYHRNEFNFIKFIIVPLYETLDLLFENEDIKKIYNNTIQNMNYHSNKCS